MTINVVFPQRVGSPPSKRSGAAPGVAASAPVGWHVFARPVAFAESGAAPSALSACRCSFSWWLVGALLPAAAGVSDDLGFAGQLTGPAGVDISCRFRRSRYSEACFCGAEARWLPCSRWNELPY